MVHHFLLLSFITIQCSTTQSHLFYHSLGLSVFLTSFFFALFQTPAKRKTNTHTPLAKWFFFSSLAFQFNCTDEFCDEIVDRIACSIDTWLVIWYISIKIHDFSIRMSLSFVHGTRFEFTQRFIHTNNSMMENNNLWETKMRIEWAQLAHNGFFSLFGGVCRLFWHHHQKYDLFELFLSCFPFFSVCLPPFSLGMATRMRRKIAIATFVLMCNWNDGHATVVMWRWWWWCKCSRWSWCACVRVCVSVRQREVCSDPTEGWCFIHIWMDSANF